jgi:hypothetical protein
LHTIVKFKGPKYSLPWHKSHILSGNDSGWFNAKEVQAINYVLLGLVIIWFIIAVSEIMDAIWKYSITQAINCPRNPLIYLFSKITCLKKPSSPNSAGLGPCLPISTSPSSLELWPRGISKESCENKYQILNLYSLLRKLGNLPVKSYHITRHTLLKHGGCSNKKITKNHEILELSSMQ